MFVFNAVSLKEKSNIKNYQYIVYIILKHIFENHVFLRKIENLPKNPPGTCASASW